MEKTNQYPIKICFKIKKGSDVITEKEIKTNIPLDTVLADDSGFDSVTLKNLADLKQEIIDKTDKSKHPHLTFSHYYKQAEIPFYQELDNDSSKVEKIDDLFNKASIYKINRLFLHQVGENSFTVKDVISFNLGEYEVALDVVYYRNNI